MEPAQPPRRGRGRPRQPEVTQERRQQILDAAIQVFGRRGYHEATMQEIARSVGVSVGLIYQYYKDKEDLLYAVINDILDSYLREIPAAQAGESEPLARLRAGVQAYCRVVDEHRAATLIGYRASRALSRERLKAIMEKELQATSLIAASVEACRAAGLLPETDTALLSYQIVIYVHSWVLHAWRLQPQMTRQAYVDRGLDQLLGIQAAAARPARRRRRPAARA